MEFYFEARVKLTLDHIKNDPISKHVATEFNLEISNNLVRDKYLKDNLPTKEGSHALTNVLIQGLVGNIHMAHKEGFRDSAEHIRYIIKNLEDGFIAQADMEIGTFDTKL